MLERVKPSLFITFAICFSLTLTNCGSNSNSSSSSSSVEDTATRSCSETLDVAVHEHTLAENENLCASSTNVLVMEFEHAGGDPNDKDSGEGGVDIIPYKIETDGAYAFGFEAEGNNPHYVIMKDSAGNQVFRIEANGEEATVDLKAGSYNLFLHNKGSESFALFLQPDNTGIDDSARMNEELFYSQWAVTRMFFTHKCPRCDLSHAILPLALYYKADLASANLTYATLTYADLRGANLSHANMAFVNLVGANLFNANLTGASLVYANLLEANLHKANLSHADLTYASAGTADLTDSNLSFANLTGFGTLSSKGADRTGSYYYQNGDTWIYFEEGGNSGYMCHPGSAMGC